MKSLKKVAAIHDIAGFGRSSLTVVIPVMSVMGHQTCPVPTAVLSTITGFYEGFEMHDLTFFLPKYLAHWEKENLKFDCIYTGFLGSARQAEIAGDFIDRFNASLNVVDPVFADGGEIYSCFDKEIIGAMAKLCKKADIITPNVTEAAFLLGGEKPIMSVKEAALAAKRLCGGNTSVIITSVPDGDSVAIVVYNRESGSICKISNPFISHAHYPGTGDLFTSVLTGALLSGGSMEECASKAADFVFASIKTAYENAVPVREGVPLELMLPRLFENHSLEIKKL